MKGHEVVTESDQWLLLRLGGTPFARGRINNPKNGLLSLRSSDSFPRGEPWAHGPAPETMGGVLRYELPENHLSNHITFLFDELFGMTRAVVSHRFKLWWARPVFLHDIDDCPGRTIFMLWEREDGSYGMILPLLCGVFRSELHGGRDGMRLIADSNARSARGDACNLALLGAGEDPYRLIAQVCWAAQRICPDMGPGSRPARPEFSRFLGWTTAGSKRSPASSVGLLEAVRAFREAEIPLGTVLLSDGWQQVNSYRQLTGMGVDPEAFPGGLRAWIEVVKRECGVRHIGVGMALQGGWSGIDPTSELGMRLELFETERMLSESGRGRRMKMSMFTPDSAEEFFDAYFAAMASEGVDFIKCDNEGSLEDFLAGHYGFDAVKVYQSALRKAARRHMRPWVIHCMAMSGDNLFNHQGEGVLRTSDDCTQDRPHGVGEHLMHNSYNNLWTSRFAIPDWDGFPSAGADGMMHAAARTLSGGPVFLSDEPGAHDKAVVDAVVLSDGRILGANQAAQPSPSCLFRDPRQEPIHLKIFSYAADDRIGLLGCFNVKLQPDEIEDQVSVADCPALNPAAGYVVYDRTLGLVGRIGRGRTVSLLLPPNRFGLLTIAPVSHGVAALGLGDKLASGAGLLDFGWDEPRRIYRARCVEGGRLVFFSKLSPTAVLLDGARAEYTLTKGLLQVCSNALGRPVTVELQYKYS